MTTSFFQVLLASLTLWSCSPTSQTTETSVDTMSTTETSVPTTTTPPDKVTVISFSTSAGEMVTERVLNIELDSQSLVTIECTADILLGYLEEKHKVSSPSSAYTHSLRLRGLLAETSYSCTTVNTEQNATVDFTTGPLPGALVGRFNSPTGTPPSGFMLLNTFDGPSDGSYWLIIQDYWGNVRWYVDATHHGTGILAAEYEPDAGGIITGGVYSSELGPLSPPSGYDLSGELWFLANAYGDHDIDYIDGSLYFPLQRNTVSCVQRWSFDTLKQTWEWCAPKASGGTVEGYNINSIAVSEDESVLLMTTFSPLEGIVKVNIDTGNMDWRLHPEGASPGLSVDTPISGLGLQHDVAFIDCDSADYDICLLVYDNGSAPRGYSQILSYGVNETNMTATLLRSFTRDGWYESHSGGVHEMPNREWLITLASLNGISKTAYLIVDVEGLEVWEMTSKTTVTGGYRARHIAPCDIFNHTGMCPE